MRRMIACIILALLTSGSSIYAACKTEACKSATAWKSGYSAIVLDDDITPERYQAVLAAVASNGGTVAIEVENVLLGWVPTTASAKLRREDGVRAVMHTPVPRIELNSRGDGGRAALRFFNSVLSGEYEETVEAGLRVNAKPLTSCVVGRGERTENAGATTSAGRLSGVAGKFRNASAEWDGVPPHRNPDMRGRVTVQVFRVDSSWQQPAIDEFTWTTERLTYANNQILAGFTFWVNQAAGRSIPLSFRVKFVSLLSHYTRTEPRIWVSWEPIRTDYDQHHLWVNDALVWVGFGATNPTPDAVFNNNEAYNLSMLNDTNGPYDRSFSVYLVYNPPDLGAPSEFPYDNVGFEVTRAYAVADGPYTIMMWNSGGWMPENIGLTLTHETAHIFWACDEYSGGCQSCLNCRIFDGPRNRQTHPWIQNRNCQSGDVGGAACSNADCVMRNNAHALCLDTPMQVGW